MIDSDALVTVLVVISVVCSGAAGGVAAATAAGHELSESTSLQDDAAGNESLPRADAVYVSESGDIILEYANDDPEDAESASAEISGDMTEGLLYGMLKLTNESLQGAASGNASFSLTPEEMVGAATLQTDQPDWIHNLDLEANSTVTAETSGSELAFEGVFSTGERDMDPDVTAADARGEVEMTGDAIRSTSNMSATYATSPVEMDMSHHVVVQERDDDVTVDVTQTFPLDGDLETSFGTEESAVQTIEFGLQSVLQEFDTDVTVEMHSYAIDQETTPPTVSMEYTATLGGVEPTLNRLIATQLARDDPELSSEAAQQVVADASELTLNELSVGVTARDDTLRMNRTVSVTSYDALVEAANTYVASTETDRSTVDDLDTLTEQIAAQQEADFVSRVVWDAAGEVESERVSVDGRLATETENWAEYVDALESRGLGGTVTEQLFEMQVSDTDSGTITGSGEFTARQDGLVAETFAPLEESLEPGSQEHQVVTALNESSLEQLRVDTGVANGTLATEAGVSVANSTALQQAFDSVFAGDGTVTRVSGDIEHVQIHVDGAVQGDVTETAVRSHPAVGSETTVHLPGDWEKDETIITSADADDATTFLNSQPGTDDVGNPADGETSGGAPLLIGGGMLAVIAVVGGIGALAYRRRQ